jgi:hypothetical protein
VILFCAGGTALIFWIARVLGRPGREETDPEFAFVFIMGGLAMAALRCFLVLVWIGIAAGVK